MIPIELGIDTFGDVTTDAAGRPKSHAQVLRDVVDGMGTAGGHDKRAGGVVPLADPSPKIVEQRLTELRRKLLVHLEIDEHQGRRLLNDCSRISAP